MQPVILHPPAGIAGAALIVRALEGNPPAFDDAIDRIVNSLNRAETAGILEGVQQCDRADFTHVTNPVHPMMRILRALAANETEQISAILKMQVLSVVRNLVHCLYLKSEQEQRKLTPELQTELKELLDRIERTRSSSDLDTYTLEHQIASCRAGVGMLVNLRLLASDHIEPFITLVFTRDPNNLVPFLRVGADLLRDLYNKSWYAKILHFDKIVEGLNRGVPAEQPDLFRCVERFTQENEKKEWEVVVAMLDGLTRVATTVPTLQKKMYFSEEQWKGLSSYLSFDLFRLKNNWRVRERALQCILRLLAHPSCCDAVRMRIEDQLLQRALVETDKRVQRVLEHKENIVAVHLALQQSWRQRPNQIETFMTSLQQEISATRDALREAIQNQQGEQALFLQQQAELQKVLLENLSQKAKEIEQFGIHIPSLREIPALLEKHTQLLQDIFARICAIDQKIDILMGEPVEEVLQRIYLRMRADEYRQREQSLYVETDCVSRASALQARQQEPPEPLETVYRHFLNGPKKVLLVAAFAGSGKTMFTQRVEEELMKQFLEGGFSDAAIRIPLRIELAGLQDPLHCALDEGLRNKGFSPQHIEALKQRKVLLILDGVDEAFYQGRRLTQQDHLYYTNQLYQWSDLKVIFGFRIENIEAAADVSRFSPYANESNTSRRSDLLQTAFLCPFSSRKIREYLQRYVHNAPPIWKRAYPEWTVNEGRKYEQEFDRISGIPELIERPFTLRVLAEVLPGIMEQQRGNSAEMMRITKEQLYEAFIARWIQREKDKLIGSDIPREIEDFEAAVLEYCTLLAGEMRGKEKIVYKAPTAFAQSRNQHTQERWDDFFGGHPVASVCRRGAPLKRTGGEYAFIHPEIQKYFVALYMCQQE